MTCSARLGSIFIIIAGVCVFLIFRRYNSQLTTMKRELKCYKTKMADQQKTILDYATRLDENDKKNEEMSRKYSTLLQVSYFRGYFLKMFE